jgi:predicted ATPase
MKLLAKEPESRYQSTLGTKADFESCLHQVRTRGTVKTFQLARNDIPERFEIPQRLYGRERETEILVNAFEGVARGGKEITLVSGEAGIGKTSLVKEIYKTLTRGRGYFVSGKFDQFHRNVPVSAMVTALRKLINHILSENKDSLAAWKSKLQDALGATAQIIIDVIPELEHVVGPQPPVPEIGALESQNRFRIVFQNFVRALCHQDHPLVD